MADRSAIEWTDATWNPIAGCARVSEGCRHCYAERQAARGLPGFAGLARFIDRPDGAREARWTGSVTIRESLMDQPLRWKRPRRIFVNSVSDLFHDAVPNEVIDRIFAIMALSPQHTFQILTKRPERMRKYLADDRRDIWAEAWGPGTLRYSRHEIQARISSKATPGQRRVWNAEQRPYPLPNVWLGGSVEDQVTADVRRPYLETIAAAGWNTFASYEPALGHVAWTGWEFLKWLISGGESGPNARPSHPDWHRDARDFCTAHGIPYLFKQWGEWAPGENVPPTITSRRQHAHWWDDQWMYGTTNMGDPEDGWDNEPDVYRIGKRAAGRFLDGVVHHGMPGSA